VLVKGGGAWWGLVNDKPKEQAGHSMGLPTAMQSGRIKVARPGGGKRKGGGRSLNHQNARITRTRKNHRQVSSFPFLCVLTPRQGRSAREKESQSEGEQRTGRDIKDLFLRRAHLEINQKGGETKKKVSSTSQKNTKSHVSHNKTESRRNWIKKAKIRNGIRLN